MLFGHQDDNENKKEEDTQVVASQPDDDADSVVTPETVEGISLPAVQPQSDSVDEYTHSPTSVLNQPTSDDDSGSDESVDSGASLEVPSEAGSLETAPESRVILSPTPAPQTEPTPTLTPRGVQDGSDDLLELKTQALNQLSPLIQHLDQTPEERFRTTMMLIQSTDNKSLLKNAYNAANEITDDKIRAQALLDVVNEINYFTQAKAN